jgi:hypothetical protein
MLNIYDNRDRRYGTSKQEEVSKSACIKLPAGLGLRGGAQIRLPVFWIRICSDPKLSAFSNSDSLLTSDPDPDIDLSPNQVFFELKNSEYFKISKISTYDQNLLACIEFSSMTKK